jgi:hypothetical protein
MVTVSKEADAAPPLLEAHDLGRRYPGGVGVAEASATLVLVSLGVGEGAAAAVILLDRVLGVYLPALLGWVPAARVDLGALFADVRPGGD